MEDNNLNPTTPTNVPSTPLDNNPITPTPQPDQAMAPLRTEIPPTDPMSVAEATFNPNGTVREVENAAPMMPESPMATAPTMPMAEPVAAIPADVPPTPPARKSNGMLFALIGVAVFLILLFSAVGALVLAAYGKIQLPDKKLQEMIAFKVQDIPFMPKTPKYVLLKSGLVHQGIGSANTKISLSAKSDEFTQIPGIGDTLEFLMEGPVDYTDTENPKASLNLKLTRELDLDFKFLDKKAYFKLNKLPAAIYPLMGLTTSNFESNPFLNRWVYQDMSTMETDASEMLDNRTESETVDEVTENKLILLGEKLSKKMTLTEETKDGVGYYKVSMILTQEDLHELEPDIVELLELEKSGLYETSYQSSNSIISMLDNLEVNVWVEKGTFYMRRFDSAVDIYESAMDGYSQVLGISTIANESTTDKVISIAMSASLDELGGTFAEDFTIPSQSITFEQYMLDISEFFAQQRYGSMTDTQAGGDIEGFEDPQVYAPPTGRTPALDEGMGY
jgi:hypothetical protein